MSETSGGPVAPGVASGAQEFFRKRKRAFYRAEKRGELNLPVLNFLMRIAMRRMQEDMNRVLHSKLF